MSHGLTLDIVSIVNDVAQFLSDYVLVVLLLIAAICFTVASRGVQFTCFSEMIRLLARSGSSGEPSSDGGRTSSVSSFQAFSLSIASRVGTGNLAGVAVAITLGGPGAVFWMWVIALLGAATAFVESTLAQLYKVRGESSYIGGPAYYILHGIHRRWWAVTFAVLMILTFALSFSSLQSNTIAHAVGNSIGIPEYATGIVLSVVTLLIICGGIKSIARFSQYVVPFMAVAYILLAIYVIAVNYTRVPDIFAMIVENAFGLDQAMGGTIGAAITLGIKRGLFSNEAGEGSTPIAAATATVSHPVKQGLVQALGVYTDTLLVCTATAFIILCSGIAGTGSDGIVLTQQAIDADLGVPGVGSTFVCIAIFFFAFTSIIANYYYGEANLVFIRNNKALLYAFRLAVAGFVMMGSVVSLDFVWSLSDVTMALMTICNLAALAVLGKYALRCLKDYRSQRKAGKDPVYHASTIPEIAKDTPCW